ncbi:MAG: putative membrane protein [Chloroflexi bacterium]|nr:MAG: putative membrane protein [Chloroflexota bacterium]
MAGDLARLWWTGWHWHPEQLIAVALLLQSYFLGVGYFRVRYHWADRVDRRQTAFFLLGVAVIALALATPLHEISEQSFSGHMTQHMLLTLVAPPLLLLGLPDWLLSPVLRYALLVPPLHFFRASTPILRLVVRHAPLLKAARFLTQPAVAGFLFIGTFSVWHVPSLYEGALQSETLHMVEHSLMLFTGILVWWPVLSPSSDLPRPPIGVQVIYLFLVAIGTTPLFAVLTFSTVAIYPWYAATAGLDSLGDQQLGGIIMKIPYTFVFLGVLLVIFLKWYNREEADSEYEDEEEDDESPYYPPRVSGEPA